MKIRRLLTISVLISTLTISMAINAATIQTNNKTQTSFTPQQKKEIEKIIHNYIVNNPKVLVEASQTLQKQTEAKQQKTALSAIKKNTKQLFNDPNSPVAGNPKGTVTLVEFFDYQCGHCKAMNKIVQNVVKKDKKLRVVFKELPIFGSNSQFAAKAALAVYKIGGADKYYAFHDALLATPNPLTNEKVFAAATKMGLNVKKIKQTMNSSEIAQQLRDNFKLAQTLKLIGTPTFVIGNKALTKFEFIPGATSEQNLQNLIKQVRS